MILASIHLGPIQFDQPVWLWLLVPAWTLVFWWGRGGLAALGSVSRRVAVAVRLLVILLIVAALAKPSWRREAENVTVTAIVDQSESVPRPAQAALDELLERAAGSARPGDMLARVTLGRDAYVQNLPAPPRDAPESLIAVRRDGTNLDEGTRLGMAIMPAETANRLLLFSDGNQNVGDILAAADAALAAKVPIDVVLAKYEHTREVKLERLVSPATARLGQNVNLRVILDAKAAATGRLSLLMNGVQVDLDPETDAMSKPIALDAGINVVTVPMTLPQGGPVEFRAVFEGDTDENGRPIADTIVENNQGLSVTFVQTEGRVLVLRRQDGEDEGGALVRALREAKLDVDVRSTAEGPKSLVELAAYDAVVLVDAPVYDFSQAQQEELHAYVHDIGGGLVMVGGPESFGAGGWIGSPLADALPVKLDPPQKRQMPRGALALIMHSCEMPSGNYWGKQTALAAVNNLSRLDLVTVVEHNWAGSGDGSDILYPLAPVGDRGGVIRAINSFSYGDAPSFDSLMAAVIPSLEKAQAAVKHAIIISDGDPQKPSAQLVQRYINAGVSVTTVMVFPHMGGPNSPDALAMKRLADDTGGRFYIINTSSGIADLPKIFVKEAQTVKRSLIQEGSFAPIVVNSLAEPMRGLGGLPPIEGYVITGEREGLALVTAKAAEDDPLIAMWQYGLGKSVAFTSDAASRWTTGWPGWGNYKAFWEQHVRWAMRPGGSADMRVITEDLGDRTRLIVEALTPEGERMNFVRWQGRVVGPNRETQSVELRQTGPGRYEGEFESGAAGSYVVNMRYIAPPPPASAGDPPREGNLQAAVTRPFADEYRDLRDNSALLELVAKRTGGRVIKLDEPNPELWSREGLAMPVALRPIWLIVAMSAIGMFLADVGVRRVRIDIPAMWRAVRRGARGGASKQEAGKHLGSLRDARESARQGMSQRAKTGEEKKAEREAAAVKFEASAEELARGRAGNEAVEQSGSAAAKPPIVDKTKKPGEAASEEEGMSRLLKAKKRARDEMSDGEEQS